jgi:hypothetical protein
MVAQEFELQILTSFLLCVQVAAGSAGGKASQLCASLTVDDLHYNFVALICTAEYQASIASLRSHSYNVQIK